MKRLFFALLLFCAMFVAKADEWTGTGFALKGKYVITNHHVVDGARSLQVRGIRGDFTKMYNAVVVASDAAHDMAIIRIEDSKFTGFGEIPYAIKSGLSEVGEEIFVLGYPMMSTMGEEVKLTTGVVSSRSGFMGDISAYQVSAPIQPGNSGGPMFDSNGDVVGIINAKHRQADNASYAIKSPYMRMFIENSVSATAIPTNRKMVGWQQTSKVKAIKPFVFIIYASTNSVSVAPAQTTPASPTQKATPAPAPKPQTPTTSQVREYKAGDTYKVGDAVRKNGVIGVVFQVTDGGRHGKMFSIKRSSNELSWTSDENEQKRLIGANDEYDGAKNMEKVMQIDNWQYKYPAFAWCAALGEGWYLPAKEELKIIYSVNRTFDNIFEETIKANGVYQVFNFECWSSTESSENFSYSSYMFSELRPCNGQYQAWTVECRDGNVKDEDWPKGLICKYMFYVRAVSAF